MLELAPAREKKRVWAASGRQGSHYPLAVLERSTLHVRGQGAQGAGGRGSAGAEGQAAGGASVGTEYQLGFTNLTGIAGVTGFAKHIGVLANLESAGLEGATGVSFVIGFGSIIEVSLNSVTVRRVRTVTPCPVE